MVWPHGVRCLMVLVAALLAGTARAELPASCGERPPAALVELGRYMFYDTLLSGPGYMACSSCHKREGAFTDGRRVAIGVTGQRHAFNTPGLVNVGCLQVLTWRDPRQRSLVTQSSIPLFSGHPVEMASAGREQDVLARLGVNIAYQKRFAAAFPETGGRIDWPSIQTALAAFQRSLLSFDSPYDRHVRAAGEAPVLSAQARQGLALFTSARLGCAACHRPPLFTDADGADPYHNTGLYNIDGEGGLPPGAQGLIDFSGKAADRGRFRTPSLRNVALTAPYMHDGSIDTLDAVIEHYAAGGRAAIDGDRSPLADTRIRGFALSAEEKAQLLAFLEALTDETFLARDAIRTPFRFVEDAGK